MSPPSPRTPHVAASRWLVVLSVLAALLGVAAPARAADALDAKITAVALPDSSAGAASIPFAVTLSQSGSAKVSGARLELPGFQLTAGTNAGQQIGSISLSANGQSADLPLLASGDPALYIAQYTYILPLLGMSHQINVGIDVAANSGLDAAGNVVDRPGSTVIKLDDLSSFGNLTGAIERFVLRFNATASGTATATAGALNPVAGGTYTLRAWVGGADGSSSVSEWPVTITGDATPAPTATPTPTDTTDTTTATPPTTDTPATADTPADTTTATPTPTPTTTTQSTQSTTTPVTLTVRRKRGKIRAGGIVAFRVRSSAASGAAVAIRSGTTTLKTVPAVTTSGLTVNVRIPRTAAGKRWKLVFVVPTQTSSATAIKLKVPKRKK
ncbi:MAG: hypothetical protein QM679_10555 [Patulibacter sp.]